ncbi:sugar ABC transporter ATP-binding protein [Candidatus Halocynthiibacter alkanivorans]|uniref:sugar ABC transporter ATP-binding protein n=1 Tax=Candidatus Halocynthiibacter alkanivorans TaxID=2267619 RepID=UPI000DF14058|nr:sugar ABC transporter ATP-binding protein [Candidatus Halocynthiibacter alkanivorans]
MKTNTYANGEMMRLEKVSKSFAANLVLDQVDFTMRAGSVIALAGENGAGKSTLMNVISGVHPRSAGEIYLRGKPVNFNNPRQAIEAGIAIIHQELNLLDELTVAENIFLGREPVGAMRIIDQARIERETQALLTRLKQGFSPGTRVGSLSIAQQQMVEVAKALSFDADVIIMDEPTDALSDVETATLFEIVSELKKEGRAIAFITHRLAEIFQICDRVAILRDGSLVHEGPTSEVTETELIRHMVGRELSHHYPYAPAVPGETRVSVNNLSGAGFNNVSFQARAGEVVGFSGLIGAGRTELAKAIYGANPIISGHLTVNGREISPRGPHDGVAAKIGYVAEDRKAEGLVQMHSLGSNITLGALQEMTGRAGLIDRQREKTVVDRFISLFGIKTQGADKPVDQLSGGNQQKVSIAKTLAAAPEILILDEPTRGVDVGAKREIYMLIQTLKEQGICVLLMSSDLPEILGISDRILVMSKGRLTGAFDHTTATQEAIMQAAVA